MNQHAVDHLAHTGSQSAPAGGAGIGEILLATGIYVVVLAGLGWFGWRERHGRETVLGNLGRALSRRTVLPVWVALPGQLLRVALLTALFGMYWDISLHIDRGRDAGPLANPGHWFILLGLTGILVAGVAAVVLHRDEGGVRLTGSWRAPVGGLLLVGCGVFSLLGFPLDDLWHRLFGQDVTLFGPTRLMLIGGASLSTIGGWLLLAEGQRATGVRNGWSKTGEYACAGGLLIGLSTFQAEFDFGVPQFPHVLEVVMVMGAGAVALTAARRRLGPGGAIVACLFFLAVRGIITLLVTGVLDQSTAHFPLYLVSAVVVEAAAYVVGTASISRFGVLAGAGIGSVGLASEWGWSYAWAVLPWRASLWPEAVALGGIAAIAGAVVGSWIGTRIDVASGVHAPVLGRYARAHHQHRVIPHPWLVPVSAVALLVVIAAALSTTSSGVVRGTLALEEVNSGAERSVRVSVLMEPEEAGENAHWFTITSWQGGGSVVTPLREVAPGTWVSERAIPVHGSWKSQLRLHRGQQLQGLAIYLPEDPEIPAESGVTRAFVAEKELLQREAKQGVSPAVSALGYGMVALLFAVTLGCIGAGLGWAGRARDGEEEFDPERRAAEEVAGAYSARAPAKERSSVG